VNGGDDYREANHRKREEVIDGVVAGVIRQTLWRFLAHNFNLLGVWSVLDAVSVEPKVTEAEKIGGADRDRTGGLLVANDVASDRKPLWINPLEKVWSKVWSNLNNQKSNTSAGVRQTLRTPNTET
jgi:hypothetical protein